MGGRDPPAGGVGREVSVPVLLGWSLEQARMVALSPALSLAPRESIYQHLSQTSPDNTNKNISQYSIDPATRYPNINLQAFKPNQVPGLGPAMGHPSSPASLAVRVTPLLTVPLSPKAVRLKLLVPRAFNALPVADVGGSGEVGGCGGVPLAGGSSLHWLCHRRVPIRRSGTSTSWARWKWTTRGRTTTGSAPVGAAGPAPAPPSARTSRSPQQPMPEWLLP